jgi:hypothetical protein
VNLVSLRAEGGTKKFYTLKGLSMVLEGEIVTGVLCLCLDLIEEQWIDSVEL